MGSIKMVIKPAYRPAKIKNFDSMIFGLTVITNMRRADIDHLTNMKLVVTRQGPS